MGKGLYHVYMDGFYVVRVQDRKTLDDEGAPVSTLSYVFGVSELLHDFVRGLGVLVMLEPGFVNV